MSDVRLQSIDKRYGEVLALSQLDLSVADGELLVCVGSSGCGKSTLLRLIAGLEQPSAGTIRISGKSVNHLSPQQRNVAMVFQDYALYPHMTVRQNLAFPLKMQGVSPAESERRIQRVAQQLHIEELLERLPKQLSGGQSQRAAMGRALVREPAVFLLDEPLSNLDAKLRVKLRGEIAELQAHLGATMLYVTHDQVEAMTLGQRVAVFHQGRLQQLADPQTLYRQPVNTFVAGFIGNPPMNLLPVDCGIGKALSALPSSVTTLGIRPEHLRLWREGDELALCGELSATECLGHETLLYVNINGTSVIARLAGMPAFSKGETLRLTLDKQDLYGFDASGKALASVA